MMNIIKRMLKIFLYDYEDTFLHADKNHLNKAPAEAPTMPTKV